MLANDLVAMALNQSIAWHKRTGIDHYGDPDYAPAANIKCRVSYRNRLVRNKDGEEVTSSAQITTLAPVEIGDKLILDGRVFLAIDVSKPQTFSGQEHRRVVFV